MSFKRHTSHFLKRDLSQKSFIFNEAAQSDAPAIICRMELPKTGEIPYLFSHFTPFQEGVKYLLLAWTNEVGDSVYVSHDHQAVQTLVAGGNSVGFDSFTANGCRTFTP